MHAPAPQPSSKIFRRLRSWRAMCWVLILGFVISNGLFWAPAAALLSVRYGWVSSQTIEESPFLAMYWHAFAQYPSLFHQYVQFGKKLGLIDERAYWTMLIFRVCFARDHNYPTEHSATICVTLWDRATEQVTDDSPPLSAVFDLASTADAAKSTDL